MSAAGPSAAHPHPNTGHPNTRHPNTRHPNTGASTGPAPDVLRVPQGDFVLRRYPERDRDPLRAWDGADEHLLARLARVDLVDGSAVAPVSLAGRIVIVNDTWGALTTAVTAALPAGRAGGQVTSICDSSMGQQAARRNLRRNGLDQDAVRFASPLDPVPDDVGVVLARIPKTLSLLEYELSRLRTRLAPGAVVLAAAMTKDVHTSGLDAFEKWIGPTRTTRAARKARLVLAEPAAARADEARRSQDAGTTAEPGPTSYLAPAGLGAASGARVVNYSGVFSAQRLDSGARVLLETVAPHLAERAGRRDRVLDLGCGSGVLGTAAALHNPSAELTFVDESHLAVASAEATFRAAAGDSSPAGDSRHAGDSRQARFFAAGTLADAGVEPGSIDIVLCNPPFHTHRGATDAIARQMFADARRALRPGGQLWVVGNRHLGYHVTLKRLFGACHTVASNPKFVVLRAERY